MFSVIVFTGCATTQQSERVAKIDPVEPMNRAIFSFNEKADEYVIKPVAEAYKFVLPEFVRTGVTNFFGNINDVLIAANNLLAYFGIPTLTTFEEKMSNDAEFRKKVADDPKTSDYIAQNYDNTNDDSSDKPSQPSLPPHHHHHHHERHHVAH